MEGAVPNRFTAGTPYGAPPHQHTPVAPVAVAAVSAEREEVVITCSKDDACMHLWSLATGQHLRSYKNNTSGRPNAWSLVGRDHMLALQENRPSVHVWSWMREQPVLRFSLPEKLEVIAVSHDGLFCVGGALSGKLYLWHVATGRMLRMWDGHYKGVTALMWTTDDMFLLSGGEDALFHLWSLDALFSDEENNGSSAFINEDSSSMRPEHTWNEHALPITSIYCGFGGVRGRIFTTSKDQTCKVWDIPSRRMVASLKFPSSLTTVTTDLLERHLFVGSVDGRIYTVDFTVPLPTSTSSEELSAAVFGDNFSDHTDDKNYDTLSAHDRPISSLAVSLDGNLLLSGSHDGTGKIWDLSSRQVIRTLTTNKGPITHASLIPKPFHDTVNIDEEKQTTEKIPQTIQPFKTFLHRNEQSAYAVGDTSNLMLAMSVPVVLNNTEPLGSDDDYEYEMEAFFPVSTTQSDEDHILEKENRSLQKEITKLRNEVARWKTVNNDLYQFCVSQLLAGSNTSQGQDALPSAAAAKRPRLSRKRNNN